MKKFTKKERAEIYLMAAKIIQIGKESYCCNVLCFLMGDRMIKEEIMLRNFIEFALFEPDADQSNISFDGGWWGMDDKNSRILALLFAHEMAKSA